VDTQQKANSSAQFRTLSLKPGYDELIKPAELIDIVGTSSLTLSARRLYNALLANAFGGEMGIEGQEWVVSLQELRGTHRSNERIEDSILALMKTIVAVRLKDGRTRRVALLGGNDMGEPDRPHGTLTYSFDKKLVPLLRDSTVFGKLELSVMKAFSTKYALALYEAISRRVRLEHMWHEVFSINDFRGLLGVSEGKLNTFGNLNQYAIKPAVIEINALASFTTIITPIKKSRKVVAVKVSWFWKDKVNLKKAFAEVRRPRVGRKARISEQVEEIIEDGFFQPN